MQNLRLNLHFKHPNLSTPTANLLSLVPIKSKSQFKYPTKNGCSPHIPKTISIPRKRISHPRNSSRFQNSDKLENFSKERFFPVSSEEYSKLVILGTVSVGLVIFLMGIDEQKALALGPEGPLMEDFWDNMRRYALYALTVSTGVIYTVFQPIFELLKNPISAILVLTIIGGSIFIVSQVVSAMVGLSDFSYDYSY
ncbi:uncharacterized protein LOC111395906 [Olea europaea var. sylvestris]|uniref:Uncharacterized protein ycf33 n=1 Tax=Olea europaea subsp. europaea TaxID=158383 RepID=A0A8S0R5I6_OLEEU|nr:uncharacterized protein LOC111395906 [Olea europaea var. sylvestris]CAA2974718.1 uncharacterized protein LOC111395906 [Olea europaea subsp. europaea]